MTSSSRRVRRDRRDRDQADEAAAGHRDDVQVEVAEADASDEEVAAIVAAVEVAWPRPAAPAPVDRAPRWRFSGRWWSKPVPLRRSRPW
jgi:hypothetical protein